MVNESNAFIQTNFIEHFLDFEPATPLTWSEDFTTMLLGLSKVRMNLEIVFPVSEIRNILQYL